MRPRQSSDPERLFEIYRRLRSHFGYAPDWWPGSPFDIFVTAILTQQCDWVTAWDALGRLHQARLTSLEALAEVDEPTLAALLRPVAFYPTKAGRLKRLAAHLARHYGTVTDLLSTERDTDALRNELLSLPGVGEETADAMLGFAGDHPRFVVDAYTRRVFARLGGFRKPADWWRHAPYSDLSRLLSTAILSELPRYQALGLAESVPPTTAAFRDVHAQLTELAKHHCTRTRPHCRSQGLAGWRGYFHCVNHCPADRCAACPVEDLCATGRADPTR